MELEEKIKQSNVERARKYPLLDINDNRAEIREISQATQEYIHEIEPELKKLKLWEAFPRMVIEFIKATMNELDKSEAVTKGESSLVIGNLFEIAIQYTETPDGDKYGNLTPVIRCRSEFKYEDANLPYHDEVPLNIARELQDEGYGKLPIQFYENRAVIKKICIAAWKSLDDYGLFTNESQWWILMTVVMCFFRKMKDYLIEHKDDGEVGVEINFADLLKVSITKEGGMDEDDPVDYILSIQPNQIFKKDYTKSDAVTEKANQD